MTVIPNATAATQAVAEEAEKGYDLLVIGLDKTTGRDNSAFHADVSRLAAGFEGPLMIVNARDRLLKNPEHAELSMLVPVNGAEPSRRAAEIAIAVARAGHSPVTALYVAPPASGRKHSPRRGDAILKDIVELGEAYDVDPRTAMRSEAAADQAIVKEMAKRRHNLLIIGAERRPGEKLFFGETATAILENSDRSIVFVVS